jgi:CRP-like cAMP-binding protein
MITRPLTARSAAVTSLPMDRGAVRLHKLAPSGEVADFACDAIRTRQLPVRSELLCRGQGITAVTVLQAGWAGHIELLSDGRRQIVHLLLPGDIIGYPRPGRVLAGHTVTALSVVQVGTWRISDRSELAASQLAALAASDAIEFGCMTNQIARIGRRSAWERIAHLLLEMRERLELAGIPAYGGFPMPLTQEVLADVLGLTNVHVNRTLQQLRAEGQIDIARGTVEISDPETLMKIVDYRSLISHRLQSKPAAS